MAFDPVPWAINSASTDAALARVLANIASHDAEGINLPGDFKVSALGTPGPQVSVSTGGMVVRNAQAPGESYVGIARSATLVDIAATTAAARSDLLIAQVIDPDFAPWQPYTDPNQVLNGPYFQPVIISGVSNTVTEASQVVSYAAYAIARIDIPNNTTNITDTMIVDLRHLAQPRHDSVMSVLATGSTKDSLTTAETTWANWPNNSIQVTVPTWATHAQVSILLNQVQVDNAVNFNAQVNLGGLTGATANFDYNPPNANADGMVVGVPFALYADIDVTSLQGQTVALKPQAERTYTSTATGNCWMGGGTSPMQQVIFDVRFTEKTA